MPTPKEISAFLNERLEQRIGRVQTTTVPVFIEADPAPEHIGSGVLVRVGPERFLFTAAHVADFRKKGQLYIGGESYPIRLSGNVFHTVAPAGDRARDPIDAAVVHLSSDVVANLGDHEFLDIGELDIGSASRVDDYFLVAGFPCTKQRFVQQESTIEAFLYPFVALSKQSHSYKAEALDDEHHILLSFNKKEMWRRDLGRVTAPNPYGISGGGIWWLPEYTGRTLGMPRLHALATEWHTGSRRQILGTRVGVFLEVIGRDFPVLRGHFA
jgi:hypothetical protein